MNSQFLFVLFIFLNTVNNYLFNALQAIYIYKIQLFR